MINLKNKPGEPELCASPVVALSVTGVSVYAKLPKKKETGGQGADPGCRR